MRWVHSHLLGERALRRNERTTSYSFLDKALFTKWVALEEVFEPKDAQMYQHFVSSEEIPQMPKWASAWANQPSGLSRWKGSSLIMTAAMSWFLSWRSAITSFSSQEVTLLSAENQVSRQGSSSFKQLWGRPEHFWQMSGHQNEGRQKGECCVEEHLYYREHDLCRVSRKSQDMAKISMSLKNRKPVTLTVNHVQKNEDQIQTRKRVPTALDSVLGLQHD